MGLYVEIEGPDMKAFTEEMQRRINLAQNWMTLDISVLVISAASA